MHSNGPGYSNMMGTIQTTVNHQVLQHTEYFFTSYVIKSLSRITFHDISLLTLTDYKLNLNLNIFLLLLTFKPVVMSMGPDMPLQKCTTRQLRNHYIINNCVIGSFLPLTTCFWDIWWMSYIADSLNKNIK